jgi:hypothetical protein
MVEPAAAMGGWIVKRNCFLLGIGLSLILAVQAQAAAVHFNYGGHDWGTMTITVMDADTLSVRYDASSSIPAGSQATGFGFSFNPSTRVPTSVTDPLDSAFAWDQNGLDWVLLTNLNAIPNPANSTSITKNNFYSGATEGRSNNFTPPGIRPGQSDLFYLNFSGVNFNAAAFNLDNFFQLAGVRLQGLPCNINGGSLFLVGDRPASVPEPGTMMLLGSGLVGLAAWGRKKYHK